MNNKVLHKITTDSTQLPFPVGLEMADGSEVVIKDIFDKVCYLKFQDWSRFATERIITLYGGESRTNPIGIEVRVLGTIPFYMAFEALDRFWFEPGIIAAVGAEFAKDIQVI